LTTNSRSELYKFVRDRYDKLQASRIMAQSRLGHLLVLTGFLIAGLTSVGIPQLLPAFMLRHTCISGNILAIAVLAFFTTVAFLGLLIAQLIFAVRCYTFAIPYAERSTLKAAMDHPDLNDDDVYKQLTSLYLDSIDLNFEEQEKIGKYLKAAFLYLNATLISSVSFVVLLFLARFVAAGLPMLS
jgi:hypothetical protein